MFTRQFDDKYYTITKSLSKDEYKSNPPQMIIAERMKRRGKQVPTGARIDYVITTMGGMKAAQKDKIEEFAYFMSYREAFSLDYLYYVEKQLLNPLDEIMEKAFQKHAGYQKNPIEKVYDYRKQYCLVVQRIKELFLTKVEFD
jgi:DNA polymerase elongation subunit (family B)